MAETAEKKAPMTDEERIALAAKLDRELDEFIDGLEKRQYTEGWPEDRWEEEMDKHPFFMKKAPEPGDEVSPLMEGLQQLKYDPDENEPDDLANNYKEDGNFNFKHKNYRMAIMSYTEGIKIKCDDKIKASLHNNRSASHWFLKNYRSCLRDCTLALKLQPEYEKVMQRAANCCYEMKQHDKCIDYCDKLLDKKADSKDVLDLRQKAVNAKKSALRDERKKEIAEKVRKAELDKLLTCINQKQAKLEGVQGGIKLDDLTPKFNELSEFRVHVDKEDLIWPVVFMYPEYKVMEFVQQFHDQSTLLDHMSELFEERPHWDLENKYKVDNVVVYVENSATQKLFHVNVNETLQNVLKNTDYIIRNGTPVFLLFVKNSSTLKDFLIKHNMK